MKTINLLPKPRQQELYYNTILRSMYVVIALSLCSFAVVFLAQLAAKFYLQSQLRSIQNSITQLQSQVNKNDNAQLKLQIKNINDTVSDFKNLADAAPKWSHVIKAFLPLPPPGIQVNSFTADALTKTVTINGYSPTRDSVIQLYNNILDDQKDFYNIDYPFENVVDAKNVNFHFTFNIQDSLLK